MDAVAPVVSGLAHHAGDQVDIDLRKSDGTGKVVGAADFFRAVGASVALEDVIVKILDPQAEAGDAQILDGLQLGFRQGAGLALEGDFLGFIPRQQLLHSIHDPRDLARGNVGGRTASEINELRLPPADERLLRVERQFLNRGIEVALDLPCVLIRIDLEIAKMAALSAERDMEVNAERRSRRRRAIQRRVSLVHVLGSPERIRRIVGDEVVAYFGGLFRVHILWRFRYHEPVLKVPSRM